MENETLYIEFEGELQQTFNNLLDLYQVRDWGISWARFLEIFGEMTEEKIADWKNEKIGEEE